MGAAPSLPISLAGVTKRYGDHRVLREVSCSMDAGQTTAIIGPSGSGKSTLLRLLNGLTPFDAGEIRVGPHVLPPSGAAHAAAARAVRRVLGMIFQDFQLFPHLTALENVIEAPRHVRRVARKEAAELGMRMLERVGLAERARAYPRQLSGGQKQRVAIARALAMEPRGLLCDEVTSALDPELKHEVLDVLEDLRHDGLSLVVVTHEMGFARRAADRIIVLADGQIVEEGSPAEVLDHPQAERTRQFLSRLF
jgi:ABC-type polar amino acid transport system ATPase subunit